MQWSANWIRPAKSYGDVCPAFRKTFFCPENVVSAALRITALGVYEARKCQVFNAKKVEIFL